MFLIQQSTVSLLQVDLLSYVVSFRLVPASPRSILAELAVLCSYNRVIRVMSEERKRKRAVASRAEPVGDPTPCTALVPSTSSSSRLKRAQITKLARSSCSAQVFGSKCSFASPSVRRVRSSSLATQQAPEPAKEAEQGTRKARNVFRTLLHQKGSSEERSCAVQGLAKPGRVTPAALASATCNYGADKRPVATQQCPEAPETSLVVSGTQRDRCAAATARPPAGTARAESTAVAAPPGPRSEAPPRVPAQMRASDDVSYHVDPSGAHCGPAGGLDGALELVVNATCNFAADNAPAGPESGAAATESPQVDVGSKRDRCGCSVAAAAAGKPRMSAPSPRAAPSPPPGPPVGDTPRRMSHAVVPRPPSRAEALPEHAGPSRHPRPASHAAAAREAPPPSTPPDPGGSSEPPDPGVGGAGTSRGAAGRAGRGRGSKRTPQRATATTQPRSTPRAGDAAAPRPPRAPQAPAPSRGRIPQAVPASAVVNHV